MTQIPKPYVEDMPLGTILPFLKAEDVPENYLILNGRTVIWDEYPLLLTKMYLRWSDITDNEWIEGKARAFWLEHGGSQPNLKRLTLPDIDPDEVAALAFGATYLADDAEPVLAIKAERLVSSDGEASPVQDPDPDAR